MRNEDETGNASKRASLLASAGAQTQQARQARQGQQAQDPVHERRARRGQRTRQERPGAGGQQRYPRSLGEYVRQNIAYILSVVAVVLAVAAMLMAFRSCGVTRAVPQDFGDEPYVSPYDWSKLDRTDGRYAYVVDGQVKSRLGIDVSDHQHEIDWDAVAADGIDFAMIRLGYRGATEGDLYLDGRFESNLAQASRAGLDCGVYFFSQAQTEAEAVEEAEFVLEHLDGAALAYPVAFDLEEAVLDLEAPRTSGLDADAMTAVAEAFCSRIEQAGYRTIVYGNKSDLSRFHYDSMLDHDIWWAEYGSASPAANMDIVMWQYGNSGHVAGIADGVDMDIDLSHVL